VSEAKLPGRWMLTILLSSRLTSLSGTGGSNSVRRRAFGRAHEDRYRRCPDPRVRPPPVAPDLRYSGSAYSRGGLRRPQYLIDERNFIGAPYAIRATEAVTALRVPSRRAELSESHRLCKLASNKRSGRAGVPSWLKTT
jgi:hypothetical protein